MKTQLLLYLLLLQLQSTLAVRLRVGDRSNDKLKENRNLQFEDPEIDYVSNGESGLGMCEGDCDEDGDCLPGLICYQRDENEEVPGCRGGEDLLGLCQRAKRQFVAVAARGFGHSAAPACEHARWVGRG